MKRIILLGATGSIGSSVCDVVRTHSDDFEIVALAVRSNRAAAEKLGAEFGAKVYCGEDAACRAVLENEADMVVVATVGLSGLKPTLMAIDKHMDVALATKEVMVAAGELVVENAADGGVDIIPIDSEHSAIFQCLQENAQGLHGLASLQEDDMIVNNVERLTLTASGGPFLDPSIDIETVTPEQALNHPRWKMGAKVTVDSATMMNKGFEILEAVGIFRIPVDKIDVVVHPESIVHSLVTFTDGATLAQLSQPDMRIPIQYALSWPFRLPAKRKALNLAEIGSLTFRAPDEKRFPCLRLVKEAAKAGGVKPAALSAADEIAVARFLAGEIKFTDIPRLVGDAVAASPDLPCYSIENIMAADAAARKFAQEWKS